MKTEKSQIDISEVNKILAMVLSAYTVPLPESEIVYIHSLERNNGISEAVRNFNPDTHVIVTKEQLDLTNQLQAISELKSTLQIVKEDIQFVKQRYLTPSQKRTKGNPTKEEVSLRRKAQWLKQGKKV